MPENAAEFWTGLNQNGSSPNLSGIRYSVLALGDKNYGDTFCLAGRRFDQRLAELGAQPIQERMDCDVDFDDPAKSWGSAVLCALLPAQANVLLASPVIEQQEEELTWSK